jgi:hypothetical protein
VVWLVRELPLPSVHSMCESQLMHIVLDKTPSVQPPSSKPAANQQPYDMRSSRQQPCDTDVQILRGRNAGLLQLLPEASISVTRPERRGSTLPSPPSLFIIIIQHGMT